MKTDFAREPITGVAAGVPYVALPPAGDRDGAPLVVAWHLVDPPRSEAAMAAAVPLAGDLDASYPMGTAHERKEVAMNRRVGARPEAMGEGARTPRERELLDDYLRLLGRRGDPHRPVGSSGPQVRTCASCGRRAAVRLDPEGGWAWCSACGRAA